MRFFEFIAFASLAFWIFLVCGGIFSGSEPMSRLSHSHLIPIEEIVCGSAALVLLPSTLILWLGMAAYFVAVDPKNLILGVSLFALLNFIGAQIYFWLIYFPRMWKLHRQPLR